MKHLIEYPLKDGGSITIEVDEPETEAMIRAGRGDTIAKARETLDDALDKVIPATKNFVEKLQGIGNRPNEIEVTFGIKLNSVAGVVIASASAEANFEVKLRWVEAAKVGEESVASNAMA